MAKKTDWIASWLPVTGSMMDTKIVPPRPHQGEFKDRESAVRLVMGLDGGPSSDRSILMPDDPIAELPVIERMHADLESKYRPKGSLSHPIR